MNHRLLLAAALPLFACPSTPAAPAPPPAAAVPAPKAEPECTLETELKPGIPGSPGHLLPSDINPNGASELAALMRQMVADWQEVKTALEADAGAVATPRLPTHRRMRCAWPTDSKDRNPTFDVLAVNYLTAVKGFDAAPSRATYNAVIGSCAACHEVTCGGPLPVINDLLVP